MKVEEASEGVVNRQVRAIYTVWVLCIKRCTTFGEVRPADGFVIKEKETKERSTA